MVTIKCNLDYNSFMRLCNAACYLEKDDDYWDALWEYFYEIGEIGEDLCVFFDNLFQYTKWFTTIDEAISEFYYESPGTNMSEVIEKKKAQIMEKYGIDEDDDIEFNDLYNYMVEVDEKDGDTSFMVYKNKGILVVY